MTDLEKAVEMIRGGGLVHARYCPKFGGYINVYKKDVTSPSGKIKAGGFSVETWNEAIKVTGDTRLSPLSPTELL